MKFHLVRPALVLASSMILASCGGGGEETYPIKVTVSGVMYDGLILTSNGQEVSVPKPATAGADVVVTFPNALSYGTYYNVVPKGGSAAGGGAEPAHQNCASKTQYGFPREYGTAGQTASLESARTPAIEVYYLCAINTLPLSGKVTGLTSGTLTLINGSNAGTSVTGSTTTAEIPFTLTEVPFGTTYGVTVLTQPAGFTCTVNNGVGTMDEAAETALGVTNVLVNCVPTTP
jgi:hypothetical protein